MDLRMQQRPQRWQGTQLVVGEVTTKLLLAGQTSPAVTECLAGQVEVEPTRGRE
jgi:hypothetical protein